LTIAPSTFERPDATTAAALARPRHEQERRGAEQQSQEDDAGRAERREEQLGDRRPALHRDGRGEHEHRCGDAAQHESRRADHGGVTKVGGAVAVNPFDLSGRSALVTGYARPGSGFAREH